MELSERERQKERVKEKGGGGWECLAVVHVCGRGVEAVRRGERAGTWKGSISQSQRERERKERRLLLIRGGGSSPRSVRLLSDTRSHSHIFMSLRNASPVVGVTGTVSQG